MAEITIKLLVVGGEMAGKTTLVKRFGNNPTRRSYYPTIGFEVSLFDYGEREGKTVKLELWDVGSRALGGSRGGVHAGGDEEGGGGATSVAALARGAHGVLFVADCTRAESLRLFLRKTASRVFGCTTRNRDVDRWQRALRPHLGPRAPRALLANKADLLAARAAVDRAALDAWAAAAGLRGWCWTVGHAELGDYVAGRGAQAKQYTVEKAVAMAAEPALAGVLAAAAAAAAAPPPPPPQTTASRAPPPPPQTAGAGPDLEALLMRGYEKYHYGHHRSQKKRQQMSSHSTMPVNSGVISVTSVEDTADSGWQYFAGSIGREAAEALLRGRPEGAFLLRRRAPDSLVLSVVTAAGVAHAAVLWEEGGGGGAGRWVPEGRRAGPFRSLAEYLRSVRKRAHPARGLRFARRPGAPRRHVVGEGPAAAAAASGEEKEGAAAAAAAAAAALPPSGKPAGAPAPPAAAPGEAAGTLLDRLTDLQRRAGAFYPRAEARLLEAAAALAAAAPSSADGAAAPSAAAALATGRLQDLLLLEQKATTQDIKDLISRYHQSSTQDQMTSGKVDPWMHHLVQSDSSNSKATISKMKEKPSFSTLQTWARSGRGQDHAAGGVDDLSLEFDAFWESDETEDILLPEGFEGDDSITPPSYVGKSPGKDTNNNKPYDFEEKQAKIIVEINGDNEEKGGKPPTSTDDDDTVHLKHQLQSLQSLQHSPDASSAPTGKSKRNTGFQNHFFANNTLAQHTSTIEVAFFRGVTSWERTLQVLETSLLNNGI